MDFLSKVRSEAVARLADLHEEREAILKAFPDLAYGDKSAKAPKASALGAKKTGRPVGYKMSAGTKAKLRAAWKRRKALAAAEKPVRRKRTRTPKVATPQYVAPLVAVDTVELTTV